MYHPAMSPLTRSKNRARQPSPSLHPTRSTNRIRGNRPPQPNGHQGLDTESGPSPLLALPAEIRLGIFGLLLGGGQVTPACVCEGGQPRRNPESPLYDYACRGGMGWWPQVLRLNKQIYFECYSIMYSNRIFEIRVSGGAIIFCGFHFNALERGRYRGEVFDHIFEGFKKIERIHVEIFAQSNPFEPQYRQLDGRVKSNVSYFVKLLHNAESLKDLRVYLKHKKSNNTLSVDGTPDYSLLQPFDTLRRIETVSVEGKSLQCASIFLVLY